jgi:hypothetical protein
MAKTAGNSKRFSNNQLLLSKLLVGVMVIAIAVAGVNLVKLNRTVNHLKAQVAEQADTANLNKSLALNEIDYQKSLLRPAVSANGSQVLFPELRLALPYDNISKTLQYGVEDDGSVDITSTRLTDHTTTRQLSCDQLVRLDVHSGTPRSPWERQSSKLNLKDGKTAYVMVGVAFKNNEASTEECATQVWHDITPQQVADEFDQHAMPY